VVIQFYSLQQNSTHNFILVCDLKTPVNPQARDLLYQFSIFMAFRMQ